MKKRNVKKSPESKRETIEEFLARGGEITRVPSQPESEEVNHIFSTSNAASTMLSLSEGSLYYSESKAKPKERAKINTSALPANLLKFVSK